MKNRFYYLDNLKVLLTMLVIAHHVSITYGGSGDWYIMDPNRNELTSLILTLFTAVNQSFFMGLFFFISGFFTPGSFDKKGAVAYLRDRLIRLGVPLILFYTVLNPLLVYILRLYYGEYNGSFVSFWLKNMPNYAGPGPLWFVQALLIFSIVYAIVRMISGKFDKRIYFPSNKKLIAGAVCAASAAFVIRVFLPVDKAFFSFKLGYFPLYILLFASGIIAARNNWLDKIDSSVTKRWFITSLVLIVVLPIVMIAAGSPDAFNGGFTVQSLMYCFWDPFVCFGICLKLMQLFKNKLNIAPAILKEAGRGAYVVYITHPFFCVGAAMLLMPLDFAPMIKFLLCSIMAIITAFISAALVIRIPVVNRIV
ncbi:MAG: acyltransferase [Spirochaetes bacterium]|nr:acyltransferase [Spirochaetota bacterium]MBN2772204.1 acyltransferase [Spirochaetota bacterium]